MSKKDLIVCKEDMEELSKALTDYMKALNLNPKSFRAHLNLANLYLKEMSLYKSEFHYKNVLELNPYCALAYNNLAVISFYQKKYPAALTYLKNAEKLGIKVHSGFKEQLQKKLNE